MNTGKQINIMIGLLLATVLLLGGYLVNEGNRQDDARREQTERNAERGARLFAQNCRVCHGLEGLGPEGDPAGFGAKLKSEAFLILGESTDGDDIERLAEVFDISIGDFEPTLEGAAAGIRGFLFDTIACGRRGTFMPSWSLNFDGPLSDLQMNNIVTMIVNGRWDLIDEVAEEVDEAAGLSVEAFMADDPGLSEEQAHEQVETAVRAIVVTDPSALSVTENNCGQFSSDTAQEFRARDPFATGTPPPDTGTLPPDTGTLPPPPPGDGPVVEVSLQEFRVTLAVDTVGADGVTFRVANDGAVLHNFRIIRTDVAADALPLSGVIVDEGAVDVVGRIDDLFGGDTRDATVTLTPGNYVLICNIPGHYQLGMTTALTVE